VATEPRFLVDDQSVDGTRIIAAGGELHLTTAPRMAAHLQDAVRSGSDRLVVDLMAVQFVDSTGLGVLISAQREILRRGGRMVIAAANPTVLRIFAITGTDATLEIHGSREAALAAVSREGTQAPDA
jgi:anti-sigma B factor antagonist